MTSEYDLQGRLLDFVLERTEDPEAREAVQLLSFLIQEQHEMAHDMGNKTIKGVATRKVGHVKLAATDHWLRLYPGTAQTLDAIEKFLFEQRRL